MLDYKGESVSHDHATRGHLYAYLHACWYVFRYAALELYECFR